MPRPFPEEQWEETKVTRELIWAWRVEGSMVVSQWCMMCGKL